MPRTLATANPTRPAVVLDGALRLPMFGPARLEWRGQAVRLRRKSLAILYYLAVEGATRRQLLADLLWDQLDPAQNLRVELHNLRKTLAGMALRSFESSMDPLVLPAGMRLEQNGEDGDPLEGLEELSPAFQDWLEEQRALLSRKGPKLLVHRDLLASLNGLIRPPYLLILSAEPDSGQDAFVSSLATSLGLRRTTDVWGSEPALRHLQASMRFDEQVVQRIAEDKTSLWLVERSSFGEDSKFLLSLRGSYAPGRTKFIELPGLSWREVQGQLQGTVPFPEAAELYGRTSGHPGYLRELLELRKAGRPSDPGQIPQRIRAAYQLEARHLSLDARFALERASIHPGLMSEGLLRALEVEPHLIELERRNWLVLENGWRFKGRVPRTAIYMSLAKGQSLLYHRMAANYLESAGNRVAAEYHKSIVNGRVDWQRVGEGLSDWGARLVGQRLGQAPLSEPAPRKLEIRDESPLLESRVFGEQVEAQAGEAVFVRQPSDAGPAGAEWELLTSSGVLHLEGRAYVRNALDVGLDGDSPPLKVEFLGAAGRTVIFAQVGSGCQVDENTLLLPLAEELDCYLEFENCLFVRVTSSADAAVIELTLTSYEATPADGDEGVEAF